MADLYAVLGVDRAADARTLRTAYRSLARKTHPDFGGDERAMMTINEAWQVLGNPVRRAAYDARLGGPSAHPSEKRGGSAVLDFGRYVGWSLAEIAVSDDDYLVWLSRSSAGHRYRREIDKVLAERDKAIADLRPVGRPRGGPDGRREAAT